MCMRCIGEALADVSGQADDLLKRLRLKAATSFSADTLPEEIQTVLFNLGLFADGLFAINTLVAEMSKDVDLSPSGSLMSVQHSTMLGGIGAGVALSFLAARLPTVRAVIEAGHEPDTQAIWQMPEVQALLQRPSTQLDDPTATFYDALKFLRDKYNSDLK